MADHTDRTDRNDRENLLMLLILLLLIVAGMTAALFLWPKSANDHRHDIAQKSGSETRTAESGQRFEYSDFYHATEGTWIISDDGILVLKERKFITESEIDRYSVHKITGQDRVRIVQSSRRWKKCEVARDGKTIAEGWIDANFVRNVKRVETNE